jgi:Fe-coproporphyrin III synthase
VDLSNLNELKSVKLPLDAFVNVTHRCNSKCIMCDVWNRQPGEEVEASAYSKLPSSLKNVNVSGGEAFLRSDLADIIKVIHATCTNAEITISSNGILTHQIRRQINNIVKVDPEIRIMISIDGIGEVHDKVRGVKGAFTSAMESLEVMKTSGVKKLGISSMATNSNLGEVSKVIELAKKKKVDFTFCGVPNRSSLTLAKDVYHIDDLDKLKVELDYVTKVLLKSTNLKNWVRAYVSSGDYYYATTNKREIPCFAGTDFFFMTPNANVYPCMVNDYCLGNLKTKSFNEIWNSKKAQDFREKVKEAHGCPCPCWMLCTVWPHMRRNKLQCLTWFVPNKIRAHFGLQINPIQG